MSARRRKLFWWLALLVLPLLNPLVGLPLEYHLYVAGALAVALDGTVLWLVARGGWGDRSQRRRKVALGWVLAVLLTIPLGLLELFALLWISCGTGGFCFD